jgi:hypothetical protein
MKPRDLPIFKQSDARKIVQEVCAAHEVTPLLLQKLAEIERNYAGFGRNDGISEDFDRCFDDFEVEQREAVR